MRSSGVGARSGRRRRGRLGAERSAAGSGAERGWERGWEQSGAMPGAALPAPRLWLGAAVLGWLAAAGARRRGKGPGHGERAGHRRPQVEQPRGEGGRAAAAGQGQRRALPRARASPAARAGAAVRHRLRWNRLNFTPAKAGTVLVTAHLRGKPAGGSSKTRRAGSPTLCSWRSCACWSTSWHILTWDSAKPVSAYLKFRIENLHQV